MSTRKAVVHKTKGVAEIRSDVPLPKLRDEYIIVKTKAVALNPTDWKSLDGRTSAGAIVGCDYAGVVEEVGKAVTTPFKKGEKVAGFVFGGKISFEPASLVRIIERAIAQRTTICHAQARTTREA